MLTQSSSSCRSAWNLCRVYPVPSASLRRRAACCNERQLSCNSDSFSRIGAASSDRFWISRRDSTSCSWKPRGKRQGMLPIRKGMQAKPRKPIGPEMIPISQVMMPMISIVEIPCFNHIIILLFSNTFLRIPTCARPKIK